MPEMDNLQQKSRKNVRYKNCFLCFSNEMIATFVDVRSKRKEGKFVRVSVKGEEFSYYLRFWLRRLGVQDAWR